MLILPDRVFQIDHRVLERFDGDPVHDEEAASENQAGDLADDDQNQDDQADDANDADPGDDLGDLVQVLTVTARRLASVKLGRKFSGSKVPPSELKKKTACAACGEIGHWRGDLQCKVSGSGASASTSTSGPASAMPAKKGGKGDKPHQSFTVMHSDLGNYEVRSGYGAAFATDDQPGQFQVNVVYTTQDVAHNSGFVGYMVLDTACQRTCCGRRWLQEHGALLAAHDLDMVKADCRDQFQFGKGEPVHADHRAYVPAVLDDGSAFCFGAGVLDAGIPLLASNPLLKALGMVLDLPRMIAYFESVSAEVPVVNLKGHLAVNIAAFSVETTASLKQRMTSVDWQSAAPELPLEQPSTVNSTGHASASTAMVAEMAVPDAEPLLLQEEPLPSHVPSRAPATVGSLLVDRGNSTTLGGQVHEPRGVRPQRHLPVRQRDGQVRKMQEVHEQVGVESRRRKVAATPLQRVFGLIGTAIALLGQYGAGGTQHENFSSGGFGKDESYLGAALPEYDLTRYPEPAFHAGAAADDGRGGTGRLATPDRGWRGDNLRLGGVKGFKRLSGNISRASRILDNEVKVYTALPTAASRPPGCVDLLELFAGEARPSAAALNHGLHACQPVDLLYGWDLDTQRDQDLVRSMARRLRPWLLLIGYPCTSVPRSTGSPRP